MRNEVADIKGKKKDGLRWKSKMALLKGVHVSQSDTFP